MLILAGWVFDLPLLRSLLPHQVEAKANTAVSFILAGAALALKASRRRPAARAGLAVANLCAAVTALVGLVSLGEYLLGWNAGIDELLFPDPVGVDTVMAGRMAVPTAAAFALLGSALLLLKPERARPAVVWLALPAAGLAALAFIGELYGLAVLVSFGPFTPIAAPTAGTFLLLSAGVLLAGGGYQVERWRRSGRTIGFGAALLLLGVMGGAVLNNTRVLIENARMVSHTHLVREKLAAVLSAVQDLETGSRGYLLTGDRQFLEPYLQSPAAADGLLRELRGLTADNPGQQPRLDRLAEAMARKISASTQLVLRRQQGDIAGTQAAVASGEGKRLMDAVRAAVSGLQQEEARLLQERLDRTEASTIRTLLTLGLGLAASVTLFVVIFLRLRSEIGRRTRTEAALRRSEESLAVTLHSIGDAVLATDTAGRITRMNRVAEQLTGWTMADARGREIEDIFRILNEETREPAVIPVDNVLRTGEIHGLANHTILVARDGTERAIADSAAPIRDEDGRLLGVVLAFRDVTAERAAQRALGESEARYRSLFESIDEGFCVIEVIFDPENRPVDYRFLEINPSFDRQTGLGNAVGRRMRELAPAHEEHWFQTYGRIALTGVAERFQNRAEQLHRTYDVYAFRLGDPRKRQVAILFNDITASKVAEHELHERTRQLEAANAELESFSYSVSHDLRAPLRHVQGYVEMLTRDAQGLLSEKSRRYLKTISDAGREMGELIDDLLAFSRMGRTEMREAAVDLERLVDEVRAGLTAPVNGRTINWKVAALPPVRGDVAMLRQVLANLLGNAVKYTRPRAVATIEVGCSGEEEGRRVFYVRDNGAGFDMKYADKLFGVFQRLHRADEFEGTGIGLANVRRIVTRHGGRTWAEGKVDAGATFYFTLAPAVAGRPATPIRP